MNFQSGITVLKLLTGATVVVKIILLLLLSMSLVSWTIIFYKLFLLLQAKRKILREADRFNQAKDLAQALRALKGEKQSRLYRIGSRAVTEIRKLEKSALPQDSRAKVAADNIRRVLKQAVSRELTELSATLSFLATCTNSAPFIGLFGTVWGIMHAFHSIGLQKSAALATVAPGIAEALIATAFGLAVAIPASIAYNSFLGLLNRIETELINYAGAFLNRVQREIPWLSAGGSRESNTEPVL